MGRRSSDSDSSHRKSRKSKTRRRSRSKSNSDSSSSSGSSSKRRKSEKSSRKSPQSRTRSRGRRSRSRDRSDRSAMASTSKAVKQERTTPHYQSHGDQLKEKVERAIHAAALIDSELKKASLAGIKVWGRAATETQPAQSTSAAVTKERAFPVLTLSEQTARADALQVINAPGFHQQAFVSRSIENSAPQRSLEASVDLVSIALPQPAKANVAHDKLYLDPKVKEEQWIMKLYLMRQKKLNGEAMN